MFVCGTSLGLSQHLPPVWSYVEGDQCWGSVNQIPLRQRHAPPPFTRITSLPFPLMFSGKAPAVFLVFIEQEVQWTRRAGSVFRHGGSRARLGPRAHCSLSGNCYFCYCCLILSDNVSFPNRGRCVCVLQCVHICVFSTSSPRNVCGALRSKAAEGKRKSQTPYFHTDCLPASITL